MKKIFCAMLAVVFPAVTALADLPLGVRQLLPRTDAAALARKGEISSTFKEDQALRHLPRVAQADLVRQRVAAMKPMFGVEVCLVHKADGKTDTEEELLGIYNTLLSISSLTGIQYYSASRKHMRTLFAEAYRVPAPEKKQRLPDPVQARRPIAPYRLIHTFQHDLSFGENFYSVEYRYDQGGFFMAMRNSNKIWYGIIPLIDPGNLAYYIVIFPRGEYIIFYSVVCVKGANPFGLMESRAASFYNRIKALDNWFRKQSGLFQGKREE